MSPGVGRYKTRGEEEVSKSTQRLRPKQGDILLKKGEMFVTKQGDHLKQNKFMSPAVGQYKIKQSPGYRQGIINNRIIPVTT